MDREEKKRTDGSTQKRPVHRRTRRPEEETASRKPEAGTPRRTDGTVSRKSETGTPRRAEGTASRKAEAGGAPRRAEGTASRKPEAGGAPRRAEGTVSRKPGTGTPRRVQEGIPRAADGSTKRGSEDNAARPVRSTAGKRRPSAAAEELRKNSEIRNGSGGAEGASQKKLAGAQAEKSRRPGQPRPEERSRQPERAGRPSERARQTDRTHPSEKSRQPERGRQPGQQPRRGNSKKKQQKRARFNVVSSVVLIAAVCVFVFSLYQLVAMLVPYYSGGKIYDEIKDLAITADEDGSGFKVDFDALMKENSDTVAWIRFDEPSIINYPVVKSSDNTEYLTKTFTANDNKLGAIFVDMRNSNDFSDRNTFIYGHHLNVGGEMFSELLEYDSESFCKKHPNFYIYTPDGKVRTYTVFSAGVVKDTADNYKIEYASDADFEEYIKLCQDSSNYDVDVEVNAQSQIVSLSTCTNVRDDERFLVQGVLTATD